MLRREDGAINLEFVLWVPFLMLWIVGFIALFQGFSTRNEAFKAAAAVNDILSRETEISVAKLESYEQLHRLLIPGSTASSIRFSNIRYRVVDGVGEHQVLWSRGFGVDDLEDETIPVDGLPTMRNLETLVLTESTVTYPSAFRLDDVVERTFSFRIFATPRNSISVEFK